MRGQPQRRQGPRDQRPQRQPASAMPWELEQERVRKEQLEYARQQAAQERSSEPRQETQPQQETQPRQETQPQPSGPQPERRRDKPQTPALFGLVGKKAG